MSILKAENLIKIYGQDENEVKALDNISLELESRRICCNRWEFW